MSATGVVSGRWPARTAALGAAGRSIEQSLGSCRGGASSVGSRRATRTGLSLCAAHRAATDWPPHPAADRWLGCTASGWRDRCICVLLRSLWPWWPLSPTVLPSAFTLQQRPHRVTRYWGPERIETGWWRGRSVRRDYYRVETDRGHWFWIFRQLDDGQWFLHGLRVTCGELDVRHVNKDCRHVFVSRIACCGNVRWIWRR